LLVAPILEDSNRRAVYLPAGVWTDWWTGERLPGGRWFEVTAGLETLPLYMREGGIVPLGPVMGCVDEQRTEEITLRIAPFSSQGSSSFVVPVNDEMVAVRYEATATGHTVRIAPSHVRFRVEPLRADAPHIRVCVD
jgi:alpha-glucosidase (family GH31 glycosyl hydrolase)